MTLQEMRERRNQLWDKAKKFAESHATDNGTLSAEDLATYEDMEREMVDLGKEIKRRERQEAIDAELNAPVNTPITSQPGDEGAENKTGRASDEYKRSFWDLVRGNVSNPNVVNALQVGTDSEGGYLVPDEFERQLIEALEEENIFRQIANVITTASGDRKIPVVASKGSASWVDEEGSYTESDDEFTQVSIGAHKLGTLIKVSEELLHDSAFDLEAYIAKEFARRMGDKEQAAFVSGDGSGKPLGILASSGGAHVGVTAAAKTAVTADEIIDLFYSLRAPYRKKAVWLMNDDTIKAIRKLKDGNGNYLWQPALTSDAPDTILGRPVMACEDMPTIEAGAKVVAFGDFSYYWIGDRQAKSFQRLNELYAANGQIGFRGSARVDGKLILAEAIQVLQMHA